jgi:uncharacterized protein YbaP (TraB family)
MQTRQYDDFYMIKTGQEAAIHLLGSIDIAMPDVIPNGTAPAAPTNGATASTVDGDLNKDKKNFSGTHSTGFRFVLPRCDKLWPSDNLSPFVHRDILLKAELLRASYSHSSNAQLDTPYHTLATGCVPASTACMHVPSYSSSFQSYTSSKRV